MRVLHINKFAGITGGVESNMWSLVAGLRDSSVDIEVFSSDDVGRVPSTEPAELGRGAWLSDAAAILWSLPAREALARRVEAYRPDVVHLHSVYHQLSVSILAAIPPPVPVVMTLHDYKLAAPCYVLFRDGNVCTECVDRRVSVGAIVHRCIKESRLASTLCTVEELAHRSSYLRRIHTYIAPSEFARQLLSSSRSVDSRRVVVINHGVEPWAAVPRAGRNRETLFVGRLVPEKSASDLIEAWGAARLPADAMLRVVGDGPERSALEASAPFNVAFDGWLGGARLARQAHQTRFVVVPSRFLETFGLVAAEAMASGLPVLAARSGALPEHVERSGGGLLYDPGDVGQLARSIERLYASDSEVDRYGRAGALYASAELSIERMIRETVALYERVLDPGLARDDTHT